MIDLVVVGHGTFAVDMEKAVKFFDGELEGFYGLDCQIIEDPVSGTPLIVPEGRYHKEAQNEKSFCA